MSDSGLERFRRNRTRIITQGTAGTPDPPILPGSDPIFVMASFRIFNVDDPAAPAQTAIVTNPQIGFGRAIIKSGNICWCADFQRNFSSVSVADMENPVVLDQLLAIGAGGQQGMCVIGSNIFIVSGSAAAANSNLDVINGSDPSNLSLTIEYLLDSGAFAVNVPFARAIVSNVASNRLYIIGGRTGQATIFAIYNATAPAAVTQQGTLNLGTPAFSQNCDLAINFPLVYALQGGDGSTVAGTLKIINVANPAAPAVVSTTTIGLTTDRLKKLNLRGTTLYVGSGGTDSIPAASKIFTVNVSNPLAPAVSSTLTLTGITRPLSSMFVRDDIVYVGSDGNGEAQASLSTWSLTTGFLFQNGFTPSATVGVAITGEL